MIADCKRLSKDSGANQRKVKSVLVYPSFVDDSNCFSLYLSLVLLLLYLLISLICVQGSVSRLYARSGRQSQGQEMMCDLVVMDLTWCCIPQLVATMVGRRNAHVSLLDETVHASKEEDSTGSISIKGGGGRSLY